jgi:hypothetical protein
VPREGHAAARAGEPYPTDNTAGKPVALDTIAGATAVSAATPALSPELPLLLGSPLPEPLLPSEPWYSSGAGLSTSRSSLGGWPDEPSP